MPDMNAALALSQLKDLEKFLEKRRGLSEMYGQSLARAHKKPWPSLSMELQPVSVVSLSWNPVSRMYGRMPEKKKWIR
jgi:dTDP-4-amino-4,6-dideoxygalactose transaminase